MGKSLSRGNIGVGVGSLMSSYISEIYDAESNVLYVSFKTGEPSYAEEIDDALILERSIHTNKPTGFRILNFREYRIEKIKGDFSNPPTMYIRNKKILEEIFDEY